MKGYALLLVFCVVCVAVGYLLASRVDSLLGMRVAAGTMGIGFILFIGGLMHLVTRRSSRGS